ncbi:MAG: helix-turn-helix transcriptional regulator [Actinomycetota bacterium]
MAVKHGLLSLLRDEPRYGYQLKTTFEAATGGVWPLNVGQVYTTLDRLERDGLVAVEEVDEQKRYAITAAGLDELGRWWDVVPADEPPPRDELLLKVLMAIDEGADRARAVLDHQRSALFSLLQARRRSARRTSVADGEALAAELVADALIVRAEADLRWLDLCEARLSELGTEST